MKADYFVPFLVVPMTLETFLILYKENHPFSSCPENTFPFNSESPISVSQNLTCGSKTPSNKTPFLRREIDRNIVGNAFNISNLLHFELKESVFAGNNLKGWFWLEQGASKWLRLTITYQNLSNSIHWWYLFIFLLGTIVVIVVDLGGVTWRKLSRNDQFGIKCDSL